MPCKIYQGLNAYGLCRHHSSEEVVRCKGFTRSGEPCKIYQELNASGLCKHHSSGVLVVRCKGFTRSGEPCRRFCREDSEYCSEDHDPNRTRSTDPKVLRIDFLRFSKEDAVKEYRNGKDAYTGKTFQSGLELDHTVELQLFTTCFDAVVKGSSARGTPDLLSFLKENVANEISNLNFTSHEINKYKFQAHFDYIADWRNDMVDSNGFFKYLVESMPDRMSGKRMVTKNILVEIASSMDTAHDVLSEQDHLPKGCSVMAEKIFDLKRSMKLNIGY